MKIDHVMTPRLSAIAEAVPKGARLCDVGTDHGYIPIYLASKERIICALATDLRPGPLHRAAKNVALYGLEDRIKTRLSDGLLALKPNEADTVVIAGMGGLLIAKILEEAPVEMETYILQPMTAVAELRAYLLSHGFTITAEVLACEEEKLYTIMTVKKGQDTPYSPLEELVGRCLIEKKDPLLPQLAEGLVRKYTGTYEGLLRSMREESRVKIQETKHIVTLLQSLQEEMKAW